MQVKLLPAADVRLAPGRQRKEFNAERIQELADSIGRNGLLHPLVIRQDENGFLLVAGERRLRAIQILWGMGEPVRVGETLVPEGHLPCIYIGELDSISAFECELEENIRREDLTWQERVSSLSQLHELRRLQAAKEGREHTIRDLSIEVTGTEPEPGQPPSSYSFIRDQLLVARHLDDPDVAKAKTPREAIKILRRKEDLSRSEALGREVGKSFSSSDHRLIHGSCTFIMAEMPADSFDVILTDPPYGMDAQDFGDSGGKTPGGHFYDDSLETWLPLMKSFAIAAYRITAPAAHFYSFCDIDNFLTLRNIVAAAGWQVFRTPLIWHNPGGIRAPWPEHGPQRKWQAILFAIKGGKQVTRLYGDVLSYPSDPNLNHPAQKPVDLYRDLLIRSCRPGDRVLDPFCGSGTIFPAAHSLKIFATGIESDPAAYGISVARLGGLT